MTTKEQTTATTEANAGALHCATDGETIRRFVRDDVVVSERVTAKTTTTADPCGMTTKEQTTATTETNIGVSPLRDGR
jgi:hypothetical protein